LSGGAGRAVLFFAAENRGFTGPAALVRIARFNYGIVQATALWDASPDTYDADPSAFAVTLSGSAAYAIGMLQMTA
jgi:hypothetical protein